MLSPPKAGRSGKTPLLSGNSADGPRICGTAPGSPRSTQSCSPLTCFLRGKKSIVSEREPLPRFVSLLRWQCSPCPAVSHPADRCDTGRGAAALLSRNKPSLPMDTHQRQGRPGWFARRWAHCDPQALPSVLQPAGCSWKCVPASRNASQHPQRSREMQVALAADYGQLIKERKEAITAFPRMGSAAQLLFF